MTFCVVAISVSSQSLFQNRTLSFFTSIWENIPQEKVYLHTDKPYYSAGEAIWFKAYLINATTHLPNTKSKFIYVELVNSFDSVVQRVKVRKDSVGFNGNLNLAAEIPAGDYVLRAYTYWMQNVGTDYFFKKQLKIGNTIDDKISASINFGQILNGYQFVTFKLLDQNSKPLIYKSFNISLTGLINTKFKPLSLKSNEQGEISCKIPVDSLVENKKTIKLTLDDTVLKYSKQFNLPSAYDDFDVQFFPESGSLIKNDVQIIAFKAIGSDGLSVNITGSIYDESNNEIAEISKSYKGMGKFSLFAKYGVQYYAVVKNDRGLEKRFALPVVQQKGVALKLGINKGKITYSINNQYAFGLNGLFLLIHTRGALCLIQPLTNQSGQIGDENLPAGISSFSIVDSLGNVFCERLYFKKNKQLYNINITSNKSTYKKREEVQLNFNIKDIIGSPINGNYSISVTDNKLINQDSTADNIDSYFLMSSDIKGFIEQPADFFTDAHITSREKLELLMLTQAWRRFDLSEYINRKFKRPEYFLEIGQAISGKVLNLVNKPSRNCDVIMLTNSNTSFRTTSTDSLGQFLIDGIELPDSSVVMLKARKKKSITDVEIVPDLENFPAATVFVPFKNSNDNLKLANYWQASKQKYYMEGGMRVISLDELTVTANNKPKSNVNTLYAGADNKISSETLERFAGMNILNYIQTIPGILIQGESISIRGASGNPLILIDGFESESIQDISYLSATDVEEIAIFKGPSASIFGSRGGNGVIAISLKRGIAVKFDKPVSLAIVKPLGFQKPSSFYMPKYNVPEVLNSTSLDLRTTLYWSGNLKSDNNGDVNVRFYTADVPNNYQYIFEGVDENGTFIHSSGHILRKE